jgi:hypothetical protein
MDRHGVQTPGCRFVRSSREPKRPIRNYALQDLDTASGRLVRTRCPSSDSRTVVLVYGRPVEMRDQRYSTSS